MRIQKGIEQLRRQLKETGLVVSAAGLAALLSTHAVEAVPGTLVAALGKMALAGIGTSPAPVAAGGSAVGLGIVASSGAKVACVVAASLAIGAVVQQAVRRPGAAQQPLTASESVRAAAPSASSAQQWSVAALAPETDEPQAADESPQADRRPTGRPPRRRRIAVSVQDHVAGGHGGVVLFSDTVLPLEPCHISYPLTAASLRGSAYWNARYFSGRFRADEVSRLLPPMPLPACPKADL